jgi:hypothetical protein
MFHLSKLRLLNCDIVSYYNYVIFRRKMLPSSSESDLKIEVACSTEALVSTYMATEFQNVCCPDMSFAMFFLTKIIIQYSCKLKV